MASLISSFYPTKSPKLKDIQCTLICDKERKAANPQKCDAAIREGLSFLLEKKNQSIVKIVAENSAQLTDHGADLPCHKYGHRFVVQVDIYDALSNRLAHFGPQQH